MNNAQLQEAIDKTRAWLAPQFDHKTTPSLKAKEDAILFLAELQKIQAARAGMATRSTLTKVN